MPTREPTRPSGGQQTESAGESTAPAAGAGLGAAIGTDEATAAAEVLERVTVALDAMCPGLRGDGADLQVVSIGDGVLVLRLVGSHAACPMAAATLQAAIEASLRERVPGITRVEIRGA